LLILDSTLPDGNALSIWEEWQGRRPNKSAGRPCIVLATTSEQQAFLEERDEPWTRVVGKPFSPPELVMLVLTLLAEAGVYTPPLRRASLHPRKVVVDLCSGSGLSTCLAAEKAGPDALVVGVDRSFEAACEAQRRVGLLGYQNICFVVADVEALPFARGRVREVGGTENFPHLGLPDEGQAWAEMKRIVHT